jgi:hypothetical protein
LPGKRLSVTTEVLRYLTAHPDAKDTSDGILNWWLKAGRVQGTKAEVEKILNELVVKGWILETKAGPSPTLYGVNEDRLDEIKAFLDVWG